MGKQSRKRRTAAVEPPAVESQAGAVGSARRPLASGSPGAIGAYLGIAIGIGFLILAVIGSVRSDPLPPALVIGMLVAGGFEAALCWRTIQRSRVAWSFAVALSGTVALATLFGAPKIRDAMAVPIFVAVLPALLAVTATVLLAMAEEELSSR